MHVMKSRWDALHRGREKGGGCMSSYKEQENVELKHESIREMWEEADWENDSDDKIPEKASENVHG